MYRTNQDEKDYSTILMVDEFLRWRVPSKSWITGYRTGTEIQEMILCSQMGWLSSDGEQYHLKIKAHTNILKLQQC